MKKGKVGAVIVAAGRAERMEGAEKLFAEIGGVPLIGRVIELFQKSEVIDEIVVVMSKENLEHGRELAEGHGWSKISHFCPGGTRRQDSVNEGIKKLTDCKWVVIHDGARSMLPADIIEQTITEARETGAAITAVLVKDTIKVASPERFVESTLQRDTLWAVQTPQVFSFDLIWRAHEEISEDVSDDAMMVEKLGHRVKLYMGSYDNIKITTPEDLALAELILRNQ